MGSEFVRPLELLVVRPGLEPCDCTADCGNNPALHRTERPCAAYVQTEVNRWQRRHEENQRKRFMEHYMETFTQPKITGYRQLSEAEAALMNEIKEHGVKLGELVEKLRAQEGLDQRWISIGATDLQTGLMGLTRGVAQPTSF